MGRYLGPELGCRCVNLVKLLLVNGSIDTVTDIALLPLVSVVSPRDHCVVLIRAKAIANTLASQSTLQKCILTSIFIMGLVEAISSILSFGCVGLRGCLQCHSREYGTAVVIARYHYHAEDISCK